MSEAYDGLIRAAALRYRVPAALVKGIISVESNFNPHARREEPSIGDRSRGLMQILERTARGLGFTGDFRELLDPATNIDLGARLLRENADTTGPGPEQWPVAVSAYNAGFSSIRPGDAKRTAAGEYVNADYVARVLDRAERFKAVGGFLAGGLVLLALGLVYITRRRR